MLWQRLWFACPVIVVEDTSTLIALYWRSGTRVKIPQKQIAPQEMLLPKQIDLIDNTWEKTDVLMLVLPGVAHSVYAMWDEGHTSFRCWYINLQEPLRRTPMGFDTMDQLLDIVMSPDRSEWKWKDEEEFAKAREIGVYSTEEAQAIRAKGEYAIQLLQGNQSPYCDSWVRWTPPTEWEIPEFPASWDDIVARGGSSC